MIRAAWCPERTYACTPNAAVASATITATPVTKRAGPSGYRWRARLVLRVARRGLAGSGLGGAGGAGVGGATGAGGKAGTGGASGGGVGGAGVSGTGGSQGADGSTAPGETGVVNGGCSCDVGSPRGQSPTSIALLCAGAALMIARRRKR